VTEIHPDCFGEHTPWPCDRLGNLGPCPHADKCKEAKERGKRTTATPDKKKLAISARTHNFSGGVPNQSFLTSGAAAPSERRKD